jgi:hypothetical protein
MHEREQHLRVLADKFLFVVEKTRMVSPVTDRRRSAPSAASGVEFEASRGIALDVEAARLARRMTLQGHADRRHFSRAGVNYQFH